MSLVFKQNSSRWILIGPYVDAADGRNPSTALTLTVYLSKNGVASSARNEATAVAHDRDGWYRCKLNSTDLNTAGDLTIFASASATAIGAFARGQVLASAVYEAFYGSGNLTVLISTGTGAGQLDSTSGKVHAIVDSMGNDVITAAAIADDAITSSAIADGAFTDSAITTALAAKIFEHAVETTFTAAGILRILLAQTVGPTSGEGTTTVKFMDQAKTKDRIIMNLTTQSGRSTVTLDTSS